MNYIKKIFKNDKGEYFSFPSTDDNITCENGQKLRDVLDNFTTDDLNNTTYSKLNTTNKTIIGAINEINNETKKPQENQINLVEDDTSMEGISDTTHDTLNTTNKTIIGAINEVNTQCKDIANEIGNVGQPTQEQINTAIDQAIQDGKITGGGGINSTAKTLLETILRNAIYTTDQSANITSLVSALSSSGGSGGGSIPTITYYTITNRLTNCTNGNSNSSVPENTSYIATITANTGYKLDTVTVTMGGTDITSNSYSNGQITITNVTGNIVITASAVDSSSIPELPQNGLDIFFDFRNATFTDSYNLTGWGAVAKVETVGNNDYFAFSDKGTRTVNSRGIANFGLRGIRKKSSETTGYVGNGTSHTIIGMTYGICMPSLYSMTRVTNISDIINFIPTYKSTGGNKALTTRELSVTYSKTNPEYIICALVMSDTEIKLYFNGELLSTVSNSDCTDFTGWFTTEGGFGCHFSGADNYITACAYYNRPLSDVEIVEATEYFKTLEVE